MNLTQPVNDREVKSNLDWCPGCNPDTCVGPDASCIAENRARLGAYRNLYGEWVHDGDRIVP